MVSAPQTGVLSAARKKPTPSLESILVSIEGSTTASARTHRVTVHEHHVPGSEKMELPHNHWLRARANSRGKWSGRDRVAPNYDSLPNRRFEFVPLWGTEV